jgi:hypothetical protein
MGTHWDALEMMYLPHVCTDLSDLCKELDACHPLVKTQARLACKVVKVRDKALHDVLQPWIAALRVDADHILSDVVDSQVLQHWHRLASNGFGHSILLLAQADAAVLAAIADVLLTSAGARRQMMRLTRCCSCGTQKPATSQLLIRSEAGGYPGSYLKLCGLSKWRYGGARVQEAWTCPAFCRPAHEDAAVIHGSAHRLLTLCGAHRLNSAFAHASWQVSLRGQAVLLRGCFPSVDDAWDLALTKGLHFVHLSTLIAASLHPASRRRSDPI